MNRTQSNHVIVLAGGKGTRMKSEAPKVLVPVNGTPIIKRLLLGLTGICDQPTIIVGYKEGEVKKALGPNYRYVTQTEQLGTGHAVFCARESLMHESYESIVVLPGDHPFISADIVSRLIETRASTDAAVALTTLKVVDFLGPNALFLQFGRILRDEAGRVSGIVEFKDASPDQRAIREVNVAYYCFRPSWLWENIAKLTNKNFSREYYLTDLVHMAFQQKETVADCPTGEVTKAMGINSLENLQTVESHLQTVRVS